MQNGMKKIDSLNEKVYKGKQISSILLLCISQLNIFIGFKYYYYYVEDFEDEEFSKQFSSHAAFKAKDRFMKWWW